MTETPSLLPFLREASKDALKFFPSASLVGPTMAAIGTKKPNRKSVISMLDSVKPYTPLFYMKINMISVKPSFITKEIIRPSKTPGIA